MERIYIEYYESAEQSQKNQPLNQIPTKDRKDKPCQATGESKIKLECS